jgi:hypothetical protein
MMKFAKLLCWVLSGLILVAGLAHAQDANKQNRDIKPGAPGATAETKRQAEAGARQKLLQDAEKLINSGKAADAYTLLVPEQSNRAGDPDYD